MTSGAAGWKYWNKESNKAQLAPQAMDSILDNAGQNVSFRYGQQEVRDGLCLSFECFYKACNTGAVGANSSIIALLVINLRVHIC